MTTKKQEKDIIKYITLCICSTILGVVTAIGMFWGKDAYIKIGVGILIGIIGIMFFGLLLEDPS
ncbi:hypothetical protein GF336_07795 [Candidatus Woesearchaeota archaeon]|nr:hypothetical protein [Candidatus Woesearchaeota archaeon]